MIRDVSTASPGQFHHGDRAIESHIVNKTRQTGLVYNIQGNFGENVTSRHLSREDRYHLRELKFYEKYDPSVGYNTAAVLGGILVLVLVYVIYKARIKKHVVRGCLYIKHKYKQNKKETEGTLGVSEDKLEPMTYSFDTEPVPRAGENCDASTKADSEKPERRPGTSGQFVSFDTSGTLHSYHEDSNQPDYSAAFPLERHFSEDDAVQLPVVVMDMKVATADWVRKQQKQFLNPGGFILKVKSDTICPPNNEIYPSPCTCTHAHPHCTPRRCLAGKRQQYGFGARSHYSLDLNKSLPCFEIGEGAFKPVETGASSTKKHRNLRMSQFPSVSSEPKSPLVRCGKCDSFSFEPKPSNSSGNPAEPHLLLPPPLSSPNPSPKLTKDRRSFDESPVCGLPKIASDSNCLKLPQNQIQSPAPNFFASSPHLRSKPSSHNLQPPSFRLQPPSPVPPSLRRPSVHTQSSQPLHITPIIKIQNMDKPSRKSSLTRKGSKDSICSSSSEDVPVFSISADSWPTPRTPRSRRGTLVRENAITCAPCHLCESGPKLCPSRQTSVDSGFQLRIPSPRPSSSLSRANSLHSNASIPNMETRL